MLKFVYHNKFIQLTISGSDLPAVLDSQGGTAPGYIDDTPIPNGSVTFFITGEFASAVRLAQGAADSIKPPTIETLSTGDVAPKTRKNHGDEVTNGKTNS